MKKICSTIIVILLFGINIVSQTLVKKFLLSSTLKQRIGVNIWLPNNFQKTVKYPVIYIIGDNTDKYFASISDFYSGGYASELPPSIIVGITASTTDTGYNYDSGELSQKGRLFCKFVTEELFEFIEKNYSASKFRTIAGHSYSGDYANYYFKNFPKAFSGYILLAPEKPNYNENLIEKMKTINSPTYYFLGVAAKDDERRIEFGRKLEKDLTKEPNPQFIFKAINFPHADHRTVVPQAIASSLEHIYKDYHSYLDNEEDIADVLKYFKQTQEKLLSLYGYPMQKNDQLSQVYFAALAQGKKDIKALDYIADFFLSNESRAIEIFNFSQFYFRLSDFTKSKMLHLRALQKAKLEKRLDYVFLIYRSLALNIYQKGEKNLELTWATLQKGYDETKDIGMKFYQGKFAVENKFKIDEGIEGLEEFNANRNETFYAREFSRELVYLLIAKGYLAKGDKTKMREYAEKTLKENPENKEAKSLLELN